MDKASRSASLFVGSQIVDSPTDLSLTRKSWIRSPKKSHDVWMRPSFTFSDENQQYRTYIEALVLTPTFA